MVRSSTHLSFSRLYQITKRGAALRRQRGASRVKGGGGKTRRKATVVLSFSSARQRGPYFFFFGIFCVAMVALLATHRFCWCHRRKNCLYLRFMLNWRRELKALLYGRLKWRVLRDNVCGCARAFALYGIKARKRKLHCLNAL
jgi:hypothetical protein